MKRALTAAWSVLSSRALSPVVICFFLLLYVVLAFFTDEALTFLIATTRSQALLGLILGLVPLNCACRLLRECGRYLKRRAALAGAAAPEPALYDETEELVATPSADLLEAHLASAGYRTGRSAGTVAAWRGFGSAPARLLFFAAAFSLFAGVLVSTVSRAVYRQSIIEGVPFEAPSGTGGMVQRIIFRNATGPILAKELFIDLGDSQQSRFGIYPPALFGGAFVYPRYLGIALDYRLSAPDLPGYENNGVFPIYPPGKEAQLPVAGSPYKITLTLANPDDGSDPYMTGRLAFSFKVLKGGDSLFEGTLPGGGKFSKGGINLAIPDARRMVVTDLVVDYGVLLIWVAGGLFLLAICVWVPIRLFAPRREMIFRCGENLTLACSRAEGRGRGHAGVFHEVLDFLAAKQANPQAPLDCLGSAQS
jgi:hypothetical protein